uniref:Uncharacterized protein n=1 Tax=Chenopodium quinoa TaxID=63459 RepID=A0A803N290_CHEQI
MMVHSKPQTATQVSSDVSAPGIVYRSNQSIERPSGKLPDEVAKKFDVPTGSSRDRWQPQLDVYRNESIFIDGLLQGGNLGYRLLHNLAIPVDRPTGLVGSVAAQHMHDLMKVSYPANADILPINIESVQKALDGLVAAKKKEDEELKSLREKVKNFKSNEEEIKTLCQQLNEKSKVIERLLVVQKELADAKGAIGHLEEKIQKIESNKPGIRQRAEKAEWAKVEAAFNNKAQENATGFEQQEFADEDLFNADPSEDDFLVDPSLLNSPRPEKT